MTPPVENVNPDPWKVIYTGQDDGEDKLLDGKTKLARTLSVPKSMCILSDTKNEIPTVTEILSPKLKLPLLANDTVERVFPVRSVVSFDSTPSSALQTPSLDKLESPISPFADGFRNSEAAGGLAAKPATRGDRRRDSISTRPDSLCRIHQQKKDLTGVAPTLSTASTYGDFVSARNQDGSSNGSPEASSLSAQLQQAIDEGGQILATNRLTEGIQYSSEDEASLMIQSFGALIVISEIGDKFVVQAASGNASEVIGYTPDELFELESSLALLPESHIPAFLSHVQFVLSDEYDVEMLGPEVFGLSLSTSHGESRKMWCTMHTSKAYRDYVICELEPDVAQDTEIEDKDSEGPKSTEQVQHAPTSSDNPYHDQKSDQRTAVNLCERPSNNSKFLDAELLNVLPRILRRLSGAQTLEALAHDAVSTVQDLTQFQRVTFYHFDSDRNGIVIADAADTSQGLHSFEGIHFDETTFPDKRKKQYLRNTVSLSYRGDKVSQLVYRASTHKLGLDLSHCYLQAAPAPPTPATDSSVYACASIGVYVFGKLWGLISCQSHHENQRIHPLVQRVCWFMSEAVSSNIERLSYSLPFQAQDQISRVEYPDAKTSGGDLLGLFGADYAAASILEETKILGKPTDSQEVLALLEYLRAKNLDTVLWSTDLTSDFEDLDYAPGFRHIFGLLYIPLSVDGNDFVIFFRGEQSQEFTQEKTSRQTEWSAAELGKASILSLMYRTFAEIWQEKEATMQNNQLMRLLLANSAHEFRTPLNAIINYLEIALDGTLDQTTRENLSRSHSASKSLVYIINDLLDLTNAENGQRLIKDEVFSLSDTLCEATDIFWEEARQKHVDLQVVQHSALPAVLGDQRRVRQVITNLISNAVQHTSSGAVTIESCILSESCEPREISVEVAIHDTGSGMSQETVETLFCELEQVSNKGYMQNPKSSESHSSASTIQTENVLGLGLALVARIVRNMNGQLSLKSEEGKGSCFKIRLKFPLPSEESEAQFCQSTSDNVPAEEGTAVSSRNSNEAIHESKNERAEKEKQTQYHCGDDYIPGSGPGENNAPSLDVDVSLKTNESHKLTIRPSTTATPEIESKHTGPETGSKEKEVAAKDPEKKKPEESTTEKSKLHILVAEDDPINSTIVRKRLEKLGYSVRLTGNGKECASVYRENSGSFDAVLMDLQVCAQHINCFHLLVVTC